MALGPTADRLPRQLQLRAGQGVRPGISFSSACRGSKLAPPHIGSAAVAVVAWVTTAARSTRRKRHGRLLLHRLLHQEADGSWTWRVCGAKVPATRTTDVSLLIDGSRGAGRGNVATNHTGQVRTAQVCPAQICIHQVRTV